MPLEIPLTRRNLVHITQSLETNMACEDNKFTKGHVDHLTYDHDKLVEIGTKVKNDYRFSVISPSTVKITRRLRSNK